MDAALAHIRDAVALDARGDVAGALVAYEAGVALMVAQAPTLDPNARPYVWSRIGEYSVRAQELRMRLAAATAGAAAAPAQQQEERLAALRAFHRDVASGAVAGGYGSEQLSQRLAGLRGYRPSAQAQDSTWRSRAETATEEEQVDSIVAAALAEARIEGGPDAVDGAAREQRFFQQLRASLAANPSEPTPPSANEAAALMAEARHVLAQVPPAKADDDALSSSPSEEYSDDAMEAARVKDKERRRKLRAKARAKWQP